MRMEIRVSNIQAAKTLDELLDRVTGSGETVVIERDGKPAVQLVPAKKSDKTIADLVELLRSWEPLNDGWAEGVEEAIRIGNQPQENPWERQSIPVSSSPPNAVRPRSSQDLCEVVRHAEKGRTSDRLARLDGRSHRSAPKLQRDHARPS